MTQTKRAATVFASVLLGASPALASTETLRVLVTNDDGVAAPGIDVERLAAANWLEGAQKRRRAPRREC